MRKAIGTWDRAGAATGRSTGRPGTAYTGGTGQPYVWRSGRGMSGRIGAERIAGKHAGRQEPGGAEGDRKLTLSLPEAVIRQLRRRMASEDTTMRALVLGALQEAGYAVPAAEIRDRRRRGRAP